VPSVVDAPLVGMPELPDVPELSDSPEVDPVASPVVGSVMLVDGPLAPVIVTLAEVGAVSWVARPASSPPQAAALATIARKDDTRSLEAIGSQ